MVNRVQKVLENANIKLASVATDVLGMSGRRMLEALVATQNRRLFDHDVDGLALRHRVDRKCPNTFLCWP